MKDAGNSGSHTDSGSDRDDTGDARHSPPAGQCEESSHDDIDDEEYQEKEVSDILNSTRSPRKS